MKQYSPRKQRMKSVYFRVYLFNTELKSMRGHLNLCFLNWILFKDIPITQLHEAKELHW